MGNQNNDVVSLLAGEIVMLKKVLGLRWPPELMGPACVLLETGETNGKADYYRRGSPTDGGR